MNVKEPSEAEFLAVFDGYWSRLSSETLDGYRREFEARGWQDALEVVEGELADRWVAAHPQCIVQ